MKRVGNLFGKAFSIDNIYLAYLDARKGKRNKRQCFEFETNLANNLKLIYTTIHNGTYTPRPYYKFTVYEPKERIIYAPTFFDIVVQHAIYRIIYPIFDKTFIDTSFACRKGYGTHRASNYTQKCIRNCSRQDYYLKCDIRKFFYSIDRNILRTLVERKIKDKKLVDIMMLFADMETATGIPIGNLLSQIFALIYMNLLDHYIKRNLKVKYYVRYVDDFLSIGIPHKTALYLKNKINTFIQTNLNLKFSKVTIQKIRKGINFVGYRTWVSKRFIRKYSLHKYRRMLYRNKLDSVMSILGHAKYTNSINYMVSLIDTKELKYKINNILHRWGYYKYEISTI